jgi:hypothetical protein
MKTITKTIIFFTLLLTYSCERECGDLKDIYYYVDEVDKNMLPYTGFDTITFVRTSVGDTHTFVGIGKTISYNKTVETVEYCGRTFFRENYAYTFISKTFNSPLYIGQYIPEVSIRTPISYINFENKFLEGDIDFDFIRQDIDSLIILGKKYYKVEIIGKDNNQNAYFDKTSGCIKIERNNETWELLSLKK